MKVNFSKYPESLTEMTMTYSIQDIEKRNKIRERKRFDLVLAVLLKDYRSAKSKLGEGLDMSSTQLFNNFSKDMDILFIEADQFEPQALRNIINRYTPLAIDRCNAFIAAVKSMRDVSKIKNFTPTYNNLKMAIWDAL